MYPSISPFNVWDLPFFLWEGYAKSVDNYIAEMKKGASK